MGLGTNDVAAGMADGFLPRSRATEEGVGPSRRAGRAAQLSSIAPFLSIHPSTRAATVVIVATRRHRPHLGGDRASREGQHDHGGKRGARAVSVRLV